MTAPDLLPCPFCRSYLIEIDADVIAKLRCATEAERRRFAANVSDQVRLLILYRLEKESCDAVL